jgi:hypothetical protein
MKKIKNWLDLLCCFTAIDALFFWDSDTYDHFIRHPLENGSGKTGSRLFYLLLFKIDQYFGETGIFIFWLFLAIFFLFHFIKANIFTFMDIHRRWKVI